ncbi:hypothetical proteinComponent of type IV pili like system [Candidatus Methanoperedenaceae archaeon GB50]|nr:MAG: hypothetical protein DRN85_10925 [Methanosarcinales archaeon]CAD7768076.1 MAG: hypothetical protein KBONHNOK_00087 [Candidatus Methanoperedenaceae archaeon GB50]CAD7776246.1 hypothetical protein AIOGIFDO_01912 [Candidatus Methanoperedenaceae archaeon GB37]CAD7776399.1 hypothetical proteinComponent of type IV pili like system [Candidatus Methanoperedenaceae archaeon GB50]
MGKITHAQTVLEEADLLALKKKTGESSTKDALATAVQHYLECEYTQVEDMWAKKMEKIVQTRRPPKQR